MRGYDGLTLFSVGHSNRSIEEFVELLWSHGVATLVDIRRFAGSRKFPHFNPEPFAAFLADAGIEYLPIPELGGRRKVLPETKNSGWRNVAFRGYADHMESAEFRRGLEQLRKAARRAPTAMMCSEAVPWRCHRWLVSDALVIRGATVLDLVGPGKPREHKLTAFARRRGLLLIYPPSKAAVSVVKRRAPRASAAPSSR